MTKEEAKLVLDNARPQTKEIDRQFYDDEDLNNALDMAIEALEQQPSDDKVSLEVYKQVTSERDIAIEQLRELGYSFGEKIRTSEDCVSRAEVQEVVRNTIAKYIPVFIGQCEKIPLELAIAIRDMPPVTPTHGTCKDCKHWKDSDGVYRRGVGADSKCPVNNSRVFEGTFWCADYEKRGNENEIN